MAQQLTVDASWHGPTGIGRFATEILRRSPSDISIFEIRRGKANAASLSPLLLTAEFLRAPPSNAFWSPGFVPPVLGSSVWQSITIHDLTHLHFYGTLRRTYYNTVLKPLVRRMDLVFTVSEYSRQEILSWSGIDAERVVAVHHGLDSSFSQNGMKLNLGRPYVLYVGNRRPYKNLSRLIEAFARSGLTKLGFLLAVSGDAETSLQALASSLDVANDIHFLGAIPEAELAATYRGARALAFVSLYEGFGFPIIEAMGCGVPVLTSNVSSMPEVAGGAALLVSDPENVEEIALGLARICTEEPLRLHLVNSGACRAMTFDWAACARSYWQRIAPNC